MKRPLFSGILLLLLLCSGISHASDYRYVKMMRGQKDVYPASKAIDGICSRGLTIALPKTGSKIDVWVRAFGWGMESHCINNKKITERGWVKFNSPTQWVWKKIKTLDAGQYDHVAIVVPKPFDKDNKLTAALDCLVVTQNTNLDIGHVQQEIMRSLNQPSLTPQILPLPAGDTFPVSLEHAANIPLHPGDTKLQIFSDQTSINSRLNLQGMELYLADKQNLFVGVWKPVSDVLLKKRDVSVAQGDDKIREATDLPQQVTIPVNDTCSSLSFLHTIKGAGEFGDVLFNYLVTYDDGSTLIIPVKEGERIGGQLKPTDISMGNEVFNNLVSFRSVSLFISTWKNPSPKRKIQSVTLQAVAPKVIPILLGLCGHHALLSSEATSKPQNHNVITQVDFANKIKPVKVGLFGINTPYVSKNQIDRYFREFCNIDFATVRIGNHCRPQPGRTTPTAEELAKQDAYFEKLSRDTHTRFLLNIKSLGKYPTQDDQLTNYIDDTVAWNMAVLNHLINDKHFPITYIEIFNEELIGHKDAPVKFHYYNAMASQIKKAFPNVKVGGTAECWPDLGVMEQFIVNCGKYVDVLTWHMYATGKAITPTDRLMQATDRLAKSSVHLQKMMLKHFPNKDIEQSITEYNINYASWKPPYEQRQVVGTGCTWTSSVLKHLLYEGQADSAMYWHFFSGGTYGVIDGKYNLRPARTLFYLLNRYLRDAMLCKVQTDNEMVEVIAAENDHCYVIVTINKSPATSRITPQLRGLPSTMNTAMGIRYDIAGEETHFSSNRLQLSEPFDLPGYGMRFEMIPK